MKAYIKSDNKIQFVDYDVTFSKYVSTGDIVKIHYSYYPDILEANDSISDSIAELLKVQIFIRLTEDFVDGNQGLLLREIYHRTLKQYRIANAGKNAVGRMSTYQI